MQRAGGLLAARTRNYCNYWLVLNNQYYLLFGLGLQDSNRCSPGPVSCDYSQRGSSSPKGRKDNARSNRDTDTLLRIGSPTRPPSPSLPLCLQGDENNWILSSMDIDHRRLRHSDS